MKITTKTDYFNKVRAPPDPMKVAICGPMASGKTMIADYLVEHHGFVKLSFAAGVKAMGATIVEAMIKEGLLPPEAAEKKHRTVLQAIGAEGRRLRPTIWIEDALNQADSHENVVIDAMRYINEAKLAHNQGLVNVRLCISENLQKSRLQRTYPDNWGSHWGARSDSSEQEIHQIPDHHMKTELIVEDGSYCIEQILDLLGLKGTGIVWPSQVS